QNRHCLVCEARITAMQLGIDSCRACAVFYRRAQRANVKFHCKFGTGSKCIDEGRVLDCRSCRFDRMTAVFEQASMEVDMSPRFKAENTPGTSKDHSNLSATKPRIGNGGQGQSNESKSVIHITPRRPVADGVPGSFKDGAPADPTLANADSAPCTSMDIAPADPSPTRPSACVDEPMEEAEQSSSTMRAVTPSEVDVTRCSSTAPSTSTVNTANSTPVLDRMRYGYHMMTRIRKSCELALRPLDKPVHPSDADDDTYSNIPSTFGMAHRTRRIMLSSLYDFASSSFPEFASLTKQEKWTLVSGSMERVSLLESAYRATKIYPDDGIVFISYTTTLSVETLDHYLSDCPLNVNVEEAKKALRKNLEKLSRSCKREMKRVAPTGDEFLAMLALSFLTNGDASLNRLATETRTAIMQDLHSYYANKGVTEYATRIGELFCLLVDNERVHSAISEDSTLLGLMNTSKLQKL
ncbi:hypothetical protein PMAYCL1PPCAC_22038, partial [Pristionchus mayeri]